MDPAKAQTLFPWFAAVWISLCLGAFAFFHFNRDAALKRRVLPPLLVLSAVVFLGFLFLMDVPREMFVVAVPIIAVTTLLNMRVIRFCDACGRTLHSQNPFSVPRFCSKCGAPIKP